MPPKSLINESIGALPRPAPELPTHVLAMFSLKGKTASITGSSQGIGYAVAEAYAQAGANIAIWYNSTPADDKAQALSEKYGIVCRAYKCAVDDSKQVEATIKQQVADFGRIDIFVANAGVAWTAGSMLDVEGDDDWHKVMNLDVNSVYYCAKAIGKVFREQSKGSFIITASMSGHIVNVPQLQAPYNAAKAACLHLSKSLAVEWAGFARVNSVSPGYIETALAEFAESSLKEKWWQLIPMGRSALPEELVGAYLYLASDASTYTTGSDIRVDGGYTVV
ncbi:hypothetical protein BABINDRAFT_33884 [Babjeviella inositovora NRRL Y-12698]|uniref:Uncharacterized protein n=1 Tax=Babjeviella inositovora NRRL Y-12698 TaxID=984486 RepID=A0A1E3QTP1_9ASCO|nr:uncharacterized protein BABINDRAFT_33884 [Babjeviella inositovora NRRL Y-12698]ODQ81051.1 hypothetical protein BABINDRAFT_33884 [Babjeviella inositovora NRRL Y-12698]